MAEIKFKDLDVDSIFDFCAVLNAIGIESVVGAFDKEELFALQGASKGERDVGVAVAMKITGILIKNIAKARDEICTFFANRMVWDNGSPVTADELKKLRIGNFVKLIRDFSRKEDLVDFFREVAGFADMASQDLKSSATNVTAMPMSM